VRDAVVEVFLLRLGRQLAVEEQVAGLEEVAVLGELLDRIATMQQYALVTVDVRDLGLAARGRGEARIVGESAGFFVEGADVDDVRPHRPLSHLEFSGFSLEIKCCGRAAHDNHLLNMFPRHRSVSLSEFLRSRALAIRFGLACQAIPTGRCCNAKMQQLPKKLSSACGLISQARNTFIASE